MFGKMINFIRKNNKVDISFAEKQVTVEVISPSIINFFSALVQERRASHAIEQQVRPECVVQVERQADSKLTITTEKLKVDIFDDFKIDIYDCQGTLLCADYRQERQPFIRRNNGGNWDIAAEEGHQLSTDYGQCKFEVVKQLTEPAFFYGLGEKTGPLNKKSYHYRMWNTDNPKPHVESFDTLYKSIPFFITLQAKQAFGIFLDNTYESHFDLGKENSNYYYFGAVDGNLDYYFIYGPEIKAVLADYTLLTGRTPLPQRWALGYQQCRWAYVPEARLKEIAGEFRKRDIPCDTLYLDIDYMDGYRVFTWDKEKFPDPVKTLADLRAEGFKVVTIIDPGVKKDKGYFVYEEGLKNGYFATDKDGVPYVNKVWPGEALFPDFTNNKTRTWWAQKQKIMVDYGVAGIWNDMNEPASFNGPLPDDVMFNQDGRLAEHREIHNIYAHYMAKATYEGLQEYTGKRPFIVTRACFAGTQKYAAVWTGDNYSFWEHLRMSLPLLMNLGLSGIAFCGTDVGGFSFDCSAELLSRWVQVGCFTPLFRNHASILTRDQEPWAFDAATEEINRRYIKLRYRLIPYFYDTFRQCGENGLPLIRPLFLHYQSDEKTYEINDEFLCGENILVAPVVEQGKTARMVYLPAGDDWIDYWTGETHSGGQYIVKIAPLAVCPIYIKAGGILPNYPPQNYIGEKKIEQLILEVYPGKKQGSYLHYQDDGESFAYQEGAYNLYEFSMDFITDNDTEIRIQLHKRHRGYQEAYREFLLNVHIAAASEVLADGKKSAFELVDHAVKIAVDSETAMVIIKR